MRLRQVVPAQSHSRNCRSRSEQGQKACSRDGVPNAVQMEGNHGGESSEKTSVIQVFSDIGLKSHTVPPAILVGHTVQPWPRVGITQSMDGWGCLGGHACGGRRTSL